MQAFLQTQKPFCAQSLLFHRFALRFQFVQNVADTVQVHFRRLQFAQGFPLLHAVLLDARRLLKQLAPILRPRRQHRVNFGLADERIRALADARIHEQFHDVFQTARRVIEQILTLPRTVHPPGNHHFGKIYRQGAVTVVYREFHLGQPQRLALIRAGKNHILRIVAPQQTRILLAQHPQQSIYDVALARSIRPDNRGQTLINVNLSLVRERLKAQQLKFL